MSPRETLDHVLATRGRPRPGHAAPPRGWQTVAKFVFAQVAGLVTNGFVLSVVAVAVAVAIAIMVSGPGDPPPPGQPPSTPSPEPEASPPPVIAIGRSGGHGGGYAVADDGPGRYRVTGDGGGPVATLSVRVDVGDLLRIDARVRADFGFLTTMLASDATGCAWRLPGAALVLPARQRLPVRIRVPASGRIGLSVRGGAHCRMTDVGLLPRVRGAVRSGAARNGAVPRVAAPDRPPAVPGVGPVPTSAPPPVGSVCVLARVPLLGLRACLP